MSSYSRSTSKFLLPYRANNQSVIGVVLCIVTLGCSFKKKSIEDEIANSTIAYPFVEETHPIGVNQYSAPFVIRSNTGKTEYTIEIPGGARDYDIEVPLAGMKNMAEEEESSPNSEGKMKPQVTDRELVAMMPPVEDPGAPHLTDSVLGVAQEKGPEQSPSYTMGIANINKLFRERKFEFALIEINNLAAFYPTSSQLQKMKGTTLLKLRSFDLAIRAYERALELDPKDDLLQRSLERIKKQYAKAETNPAALDKKIPTPKSSFMPPPVENPNTAKKTPNKNPTPKK